MSPSPSDPPTYPTAPVPPEPEPPADNPRLPVTGANDTALVIGGLMAVGTAILAFVVSRKRSV